MVAPPSRPAMATAARVLDVIGLPPNLSRADPLTSAKLLSLQFFEAPLRVFAVLAPFEFSEDALEERDRLSFLIGSGERFRQIEIHLIATAVHRVLLQHVAEARNRPWIPVNAVIVETHAKFGAAQTVARITPFRPHFIDERTHRVPIEEDLK